MASVGQPLLLLFTAEAVEDEPILGVDDAAASSFTYS